MKIQIKFLLVAIALAVIAMWLEGCNFAVVESAPVEITWAGAALAEENFIGRGSRDAAGETRVWEIQARLVELGYLEEAPDGVFGKNTEGALLIFQEANGLESTGVVDYATGYRLNSPLAVPVPEPDPVDLEKGAYGEQVARLQQLLLTAGFTSDLPDGSYGPRMEKAVSAFKDFALRYHAADFGVGSATVPVEMFVRLDDGSFPLYSVELCPGDTGDEVARLQNRLMNLGYLFDHQPGVFDDYTRDAVYWFQGRNAIHKSGIADTFTQQKLYSESAIAPDAADHPYFMRVSVDEQRVYVYRWVCGGYNQLIKTMVCSTGKPGWDTPKGLFYSSGHAGDRWHYFAMNDTYGQYAFNINGNILFHSVLFDDDDEETLQRDTLAALGTPASHGCVRLSVDDAYWIYWNNKPGAPIEVY